MIPDFNNKGEYLLWDAGKPIGYVPIAMVDGRKVVASLKDTIMKMKADALKDGVILSLAAGLRTYGEQLELRKAHATPKGNTDINYLLNADSTDFTPVTAKPGYSNHHDGTAYDFNVTGKPDVYKWLVRNAYNYGFIRTVKAERWHWEKRDGKDKFSVVPKNHESWDGLV